jgi:hypothetical protein
MSKIIEKWLLFKYVDGELTPLSKTLETKEHAEHARMNIQNSIEKRRLLWPWDRAKQIQRVGEACSIFC